MNLEFESYSLIIDANNFEVPDLVDDELFNYVKDHLKDLLKNKKTDLHYFGYSPDNTADGNDELITDGVFYRIICEDRYLGIDLDAPKVDVLKAFLFIVENFKPFWSSIIIETGFIKIETTIELLYKEL